MKLPRVPYFLLLLLVSLDGCSQKQAERSQTDGRRWVALARGTVDVPGGLIEIVAPREGLIQSVSVQEGQVVKKGDILASQDDAASQLAVQAAASELAEAQSAVPPARIRRDAATREVHRLETLAASRLATAQELEQARDTLAELDALLLQQKAAISTSEVKLAIAHYESGLRIIRSPVDGVVVRQEIQAGEAVNNLVYKPLFALAQAGNRIVRAEVEEDLLPEIRVGEKAEIVSETRGETPAHARVQRLGLIFGAQKTAVDEPSQQQDRHVVECILELEGDAHFLLGQRVLVRFLPVRHP